ncbi:FG-GAP repeat domain-containing protein [Nocardia nepalensis]|uniref:FG-GAP repeat domain-containing protein n=1 Tax=Nocardia nepalensis TaxID=3375448 RepID=UPI003B683125
MFGRRPALFAAVLLTAVAGSQSSPAFADTSGAIFGPERSVAVTVLGNTPTAEGIATADFDGDGHIDVAMTDELGFGIRLLPGRGDGTFDPAGYIPTGIAPDALTAGDLDRDGNPDLLVSNAIGDIVVLYGDGHGGFAEQGRYFAQGLVPGAARIADFDNDGRPDFAVAAFPVGVFLNNGDRTYTGRPYFASTVAVGLQPADFDGDGNTDIVVASGFPVVLTVLYGNGDGSFGRPQALLAPDLIQEAIRVADMNGDGRPDIVGVTSLGGINVWLNSDHGLRQSNWSIGSPGNAGLALADFDGDGKMDIVTGDSILMHVTFWRGDGAGHFTRTEWHTAPWLVESVETADLNNDGKPDLLAGPFIGPWLSVYLHT